MFKLVSNVLFILFVFSHFAVQAQIDQTNLQLNQDSLATQPDSNNFFLISAIKTISGNAPKSEFFDLQAKFYLNQNFFVLAGFDIALTATNTDTVSSSTEKLTEASVFLNLTLGRFDHYKRQLFLSGLIKLFDADPYFGLGIGSIEDRGKFITSYAIFSILKRFYDLTPETISTTTVEKHNYNIYVEAGLYAKEAPIVNNIRIKIGLLIPTPFLNDNPKPTVDDLISRIVLEIPIGEVPFRF